VIDSGGKLQGASASNPVRIDPTGTTIQPVDGTLIHNSGVPGSTQIGVLSAIANAANPSFTEGNQVLLSTDLSGNLRVLGTFTGTVTGSQNINQWAGTALGVPTMWGTAPTGQVVIGVNADILAMPAVTIAAAQTIAVTNAGTFAVQDASAESSLSTVAGAVSGGKMQVNIASGFPNPAPVSGTVTANAGTGNFTVIQATGTNLHTVVDSGTVNVGTVTTLPAVTIGTWSAGTLTVGGTVNVGTVTTLPAITVAAGQTIAVTNAGTFAVQDSAAEASLSTIAGFGAPPTAASIAAAIVSNPATNPLPTAQVTTLTPPTAAAIGAAVAAPSAAAIASAIVSNPPTTFNGVVSGTVSLSAGTISAITPPTAAAIGAAVAAPSAAAIASAIVSNPATNPLPTAQVTTLTPPTAAAIGSAVAAALTNPLPVHDSGNVAITAAALPLPANAAQETGGNLAAIAASITTPADQTVSKVVAAQLYADNGASYDHYIDADGDVCLAVSTIQNITADANNTSSANIASAATYTGTATNALGIGAIQVMLLASQPCTVFIDQSGDGTNYDVTDSYTYIPGKPFGITVQCVGKTYRVRVTNLGPITTTTFRVETFAAPQIEALPRSLDTNGNLRAAINGIADKDGFPVVSNVAHTLAVNQPYHVVGTPFGASNDTNFWTLANTGTGSAAGVANSIVTLTSGTAASAYGKITSVRSGRYIHGHPLSFAANVRLTAVTVANTLRGWGAVTLSTVAPQNGVYFSVNAAGALSINYVNATSIQTVTSGSFNGVINQFVLDTNVHLYEIQYSVTGAYFFVDNLLIHSVTPTTGILYQLPTFPISAWATSTAASTSASLEIWDASILREGRAETAPNFFFQAGATAGVNLKVGAGAVRSVIISNITSGSVVTLYDNTAASGTVLWASGSLTTGPGTNVSEPITLEMREIPFFTGLELVIATANCNVLVVYE
jgi:hypothetical protein